MQSVKKDKIDYWYFWGITLFITSTYSLKILSTKSYACDSEADASEYNNTLNTCYNYMLY